MAWNIETRGSSVQNIKDTKLQGKIVGMRNRLNRCGRETRDCHGMNMTKPHMHIKEMPGPNQLLHITSTY